MARVNIPTVCTTNSGTFHSFNITLHYIPFDAIIFLQRVSAGTAIKKNQRRTGKENSNVQYDSKVSKAVQYPQVHTSH